MINKNDQREQGKSRKIAEAPEKNECSFHFFVETAIFLDWLQEYAGKSPFHWKRACLVANDFSVLNAGNCDYLYLYNGDHF